MFKKWAGVASASLLAFSALGCDNNNTREEIDYSDGPPRISETSRQNEKQAHAGDSDAGSSKRKSEQKEQKDRSNDGSSRNRAPVDRGSTELFHYD